LQVSSMGSAVRGTSPVKTMPPPALIHMGAASKLTQLQHCVLCFRAPRQDPQCRRTTCQQRSRRLPPPGRCWRMRSILRSGDRRRLGSDPTKIFRACHRGQDLNIEYLWFVYLS
jgi:hypothetical protein